MIRAKAVMWMLQKLEALHQKSQYADGPVSAPWELVILPLLELLSFKPPLSQRFPTLRITQAKSPNLSVAELISLHSNLK